MQPIAISYIRFSTAEQGKGDSLRRQTEAARAWCDRNDLRFDETTTLRDLGKSAYTGAHRKNPDRHALAAFLKLAETGKVPHGSFLIIENLDRLTREDERAALRLWMDILDRGVNIVQLHPETVFRHEKSDMVDIMRAIIELSRGHSESRMKSERVGAAWARKKQRARDEGHIMTSKLPGWVRRKDDQLELIPDRAAVVKLIFRLAASGYGAPSIIKRLIRDGVKPFGRTGQWNRQYIHDLLTERRVLGEQQPHDKSGKPKGDPIPNYYPAVVTETEWGAARAATNQRRTFHGRVSASKVNLFAGLLRHARDNDPYIMTRRHLRSTNVPSKILVNKRGEQGTVRAYSIPYDVFETQILKRLREIDPHEILNGDHEPDDTATLAAELVGVEVELADAAAFMDEQGFSPTIGKRIAALEAKKADLAGKLAEARLSAAHPLSESWGEAQSLAEALATAPDPHDARLRLRSALRRIVEGMWLLVVPRGCVRLCAVQVWFGKRQRDYLILHTPASYRRKAETAVLSQTFGVKVGEVDLRRRDHAAKLEKVLAAADLAPYVADAAPAG
jgi:DNA invertase Pin-like site-specific DNA recombinase